MKVRQPPAVLPYVSYIATINFQLSFSQNDDGNIASFVSIVNGFNH